MRLGEPGLSFEIMGRGVVSCVRLSAVSKAMHLFYSQLRRGAGRGAVEENRVNTLSLIALPNRAQLTAAGSVRRELVPERMGDEWGEWRKG